ncbi:helix-turn-helix transcriptional regulator [Pseudoalteromonas luteoviolacea]|uniref:helix-turn-helix transcriptional regulator n=1 Tax=Pseudoalteromonas luteoviolacea TaxID=43657 RepID=UPI001B37F3F8|nr:helix-turn-helix transcriptional regulator [Pseudoalteromonas luteoviolacea]MBQ4837682.1 helix-turn-helix transcriptional regulator [Pseudoalteromonas luteoviolacea]
MTLNSKHLVQQIRLAGNYSVSRFAKKMGVSKQTIYNWESGETSPYTSLLIKMYIVCGLNPKSLLPQRKAEVDKNEPLRNSEFPE